MAVALAPAAVAPGGTYWEQRGIKIDAEVATTPLLFTFLCVSNSAQYILTWDQLLETQGGFARSRSREALRGWGQGSSSAKAAAARGWRAKAPHRRSESCSDKRSGVPERHNYQVSRIKKWF